MRWPKGGWENTDSHESGRDTKPQGRYHPTRDHTLEEGGPGDKGLKSGQGPSRKETRKQKIPHKIRGNWISLPTLYGGHGSQEEGEEVHPQIEETPQMIEGMMNQIKRRMRKRILMKKLNQ